VFWGTALYWALGTDRIVNLQINSISFVLATGWAYVDGVFSKRIWRYAFEEGVILHFLSVQISNFLGILFGNPLS
jgi:hypothetical protein